MTPLKEWLKPPRTLLLILVLLTLVSVSALAWFGWRLLAQERLVEAQRSRERLEEAADRIAATLRISLAETGDSLASRLSSPPSSSVPEVGLVLLLSERSFEPKPPERLLYYPYPASGVEARPVIFADAEAGEFRHSEPGGVAAEYERLADSSNAAIRAGALVRLARVLRNSGRAGDSRAVYAKLARVPGAAVAGAPAELVARHAICELSAEPGCVQSLKTDLLGARWHLTRGQFEFYWSEAGRLAGKGEPPPEDAAALSQAAALVWTGRSRYAPPRGQETLWVGERPFFVLWRGASDRRAVLITRPEAILRQALAGQDVSYSVADHEGRTIAGNRTRLGYAAVRTAAEGQIPWTLYVTGAGEPDEGGPARRQFLLLGIGVMVTFLVVGTYFIARAIRRETEVTRMQSDFVSAVSHEFRSPLTSIRQLSEILALGRVPSEERRHVYYETLVKETARLQRLVESLLNFGRMEANARQYRFEEVDAAALVHGVAAEFASQMAEAGRRIELKAPGRECRVRGDPEAISVALRNLVDNAIKYSPDCPVVWVDWNVVDGQVAIRVRDEGPGIAESERKKIFRKFVRGSAAAATNAKGSGVGLAMVRHIVAAHGGEITVESVPGRGSTFTLLLPAVEGAAAAVGQAR